MSDRHHVQERHRGVNAQLYGAVRVPRPVTLPRTPRPALPERRAPAFFRDPAHTRPTKWSLYRPLIRALGGAAALAVARAARSSGEASASTLPESATSPSSPPSSSDPVVTVSATRRIPASRELKGAGWLGAFQGTEPAVPATRLKPAIPAGFAILEPLSGPYPHLLSSLRARWRTAKGWTSMRDVRSFLRHEETLLSEIHASAPILSDREAALSASYASYLALPPPPPPPRPLLTGAFMRPTKFNPPLPRLKPQPKHITGMIVDRVRRREDRILRLRAFGELRKAMRTEVYFWRGLGLNDRWSSDSPSKGGMWDDILRAHYRDIEAKLGEDIRRSEVIFQPDMIARVEQARRRRDVWRVNKSRKQRGLQSIWPVKEIVESPEKFVEAAKRTGRTPEVEAWIAGWEEAKRRAKAEQEKEDRQKDDVPSSTPESKADASPVDAPAKSAREIELERLLASHGIAVPSDESTKPRE